MKFKLLSSCILFAVLSPVYAADIPLSLEIGATVKNLTEVHTAPDTSTLNIVAEGAGRLVAQGESVHFYALCAISDTLKDKKVVTGNGDCELKTTDGSILYSHFQTVPEHEDQGLMTVSGGSQNLERFNGKVPVEITVNPAKVGKMVFFAENLK